MFRGPWTVDADEIGAAVSSFVSETATLYRQVRIVDSKIEDHAVVADNSDVLRSRLGCRAEVGRRNLVIGSSLGRGSYTGSNSVIKNAEIGGYCCIAWNVSIGGDSHNYRAASLLDDRHWEKTLGVTFAQGEGYDGSPRCLIGNDVWIGASASILSGVKVGDGSVIGSGAVVVKDVPPYSIVAGVPAKVLKPRFPTKTAERLSRIRWWDWEDAVIAEHAALLHGCLDNAVLSELEKVGEEARRLGRLSQESDFPRSSSSGDRELT